MTESTVKKNEELPQGAAKMIFTGNEAERRALEEKGEGKIILPETGRAPRGEKPAVPQGSHELTIDNIVSLLGSIAKPGDLFDIRKKGEVARGKSEQAVIDSIKSLLTQGEKSALVYWKTYDIKGGGTGIEISRQIEGTVPEIVREIQVSEQKTAVEQPATLPEEPKPTIAESPITLEDTQQHEAQPVETVPAEAETKTSEISSPEEERIPSIVDSFGFSEDRIQKAIDLLLSRIPDDQSVVISVNGEKYRRFSKSKAERYLEDKIVEGFDVLVPAHRAHEIASYRGEVTLDETGNQQIKLHYEKTEKNKERERRRNNGEEEPTLPHLAIDVHGEAARTRARASLEQENGPRNLTDEEIKRIGKLMGNHGMKTEDMDVEVTEENQDEVANYFSPNDTLAILRDYAGDKTASVTITQDGDVFTLIVDRLTTEKPGGLLGMFRKGTQSVATESRLLLTIDREKTWKERERELAGKSRDKIISPAKEKDFVSLIADQLDVEAVTFLDQYRINLEEARKNLSKLERTLRDSYGLPSIKREEMEQDIETARQQVVEAEEALIDRETPPHFSLLIEAYKARRNVILGAESTRNIPNDKYFEEFWGIDFRGEVEWDLEDQAEIRTYLRKNSETLLAKVLREMIQRHLKDAWNGYHEDQTKDTASRVWRNVKSLQQRFDNPLEGEKHALEFWRHPVLPGDKLLAIVEEEFALSKTSPIDSKKEATPADQLEQMRRMRDEIADTTRTYRGRAQIEDATERFAAESRQLIDYVNSKRKESGREKSQQFVSGFRSLRADLSPDSLRSKEGPRYLSIIRDQIVLDLAPHFKRGRYDRDAKTTELLNLLSILERSSEDVSAVTIYDLIQNMSGEARPADISEKHIRAAIKQLNNPQNTQVPNTMKEIVDKARDIGDAEAEDARQRTVLKLNAVKERVERLLGRNVELSDAEVIHIVGLITGAHLRQLEGLLASIETLESSMKKDPETRGAAPIFVKPYVSEIKGLDTLLELANDDAKYEQFVKTKIRRVGLKPGGLFGGKRE